ncbi:MAG: ABC transporter ATP-binding protein/permease [Endomicrobium sp.]|nr:ABC transporter ATP-binding protein/permease [Endomicrobium sp.]
MLNIKNELGLSDEGYKDFKRAVKSNALSNLSLTIPFVVIIQTIITLLNPFLDGAASLDKTRLWLLFGFGLFGAVLYCLAYRSEYGKTYTVAYAEAEKIRIETAERIRRLPLSFFNRKDIAQLTTNIMADCAVIEHVMSHVAPILCGTIVSDIIICALLAFYDWRMALALFAALPISFFIVIGSRKIQEFFGERIVGIKLAASGHIQEYFEGIKAVKAFGLYGEKSFALNEALKNMKNEAIKFEGIAGAFIVLASMILQTGIGLVVLVGVFLLTQGNLSVIAFLIFIIISAKIYSPLIVILTLLPEFFYFLISTKRMQQVRHEPIMTGETNCKFENFNIELNNVSFAYGDKDVIKNLNLSIKQGGITAFVGPSGSGKSTLSRLIARFWDAREGEIRIGGIDIRNVEPEALMRHISFVFQDVVLFNDTIINNIRIGKEGATDEETFAAAKAARCQTFIDKLPKRYDTLIGENGSTLSGGERQRISIARAFLKNAPILLLDEATASLDPENEAEIQEAVSELVKNKTVIIIAHRLRTVLGVDKIAVIDNGRLIEEGDAKTLLEKGGLFARLYKIQQENLGWSMTAV